MGNSALFSPRTQAILAGIAAAALFMFALNLPLMAILIYLPLLPLLLAGLTTGAMSTIMASLVALGALSLTGNITLLLLFVFLLALPAIIFIRKAVLWRDSGSEREWYPVGRIFTTLTFYFSILFLVIAIHYAGQGQGGLEQMIASEIAPSLAALSPEVAEDAENIVKKLAFITFAATGWSWALMIYVMSLLAQALVKNRQPIRPSVAITRFETTPWLLVFLIGAAFLSLGSEANSVFIGKTLLIILFFPYFLSGICLLHSESLKWPARQWMLAAIYVVMISLLWPLMIVACVGMIEQIISLSKRWNTNNRNS